MKNISVHDLRKMEVGSSIEIPYEENFYELARKRNYQTVKYFSRSVEPDWEISVRTLFIKKVLKIERVK